MHLQYLPEDTISDIEWDKSGRYLAVSSWDKTISVYDTYTGDLVHRDTLSNPSLTCCFIGENSNFAVVSSSSTELYHSSIDRGKKILLGSHEDVISRVVSVDSSKSELISASIDGNVKLWDIRRYTTPSFSFKFPSPGQNIIDMSTHGNKLYMITSHRCFITADIRNLSKPFHCSESCLRHQATCMSVAGNGSRYACGSVEGRVGIIDFDKDGIEHGDSKHRTCFRAHMNPDACIVQSVALNHSGTTLLTGASDGVNLINIEQESL
ncbi:mitotic checkpoint protein BUB3.1, partial [Aduncisulcus paluster]